MIRTIRLLPIFILLIASTGCDPEKEIGKYFADMGLTRVAALRDDLEPGGLVVVSKSKAIYADNLLDYVDASTPLDLAIAVQNGTADYNALLKKHTGDRLIDPSVALSFVEKVAPVSLDGSLKLESKVTIDIADIKVRRLKIPAIKNVLSGTGSSVFRQAIWDYQSEGEAVQTFLIYEIWRAKKLKISAEKERDITASLKVGEVKDLLSKAEGKFHVKRTQKNSLEIDGDRYYVFAVRTAELVKGGQNGAVALKITDFKKNFQGIMSAGTDDKYSAAPMGDFSTPLLLERGDRI